MTQTEQRIPLLSAKLYVTTRNNTTLNAVAGNDGIKTRQCPFLVRLTNWGRADFLPFAIPKTAP